VTWVGGLGLSVEGIQVVVANSIVGLGSPFAAQDLSLFSR
jgi:hypothetical protein